MQDGGGVDDVEKRVRGPLVSRVWCGELGAGDAVERGIMERLEEVRYVHGFGGGGVGDDVVGVHGEVG